jgi:Zn-dependent protease with chaperone function
MGGIILYLVTLALEMISVVVRFALVAGVASLVMNRQAAFAVGAVAGLYPVVYSLAALSGLPRGHLLTRIEMGGRNLTAEEQRQLAVALSEPRRRGLPIPRHVFAVDRDGLNAFIAGRTLYIYRDLFDHPSLPGVLAHELGHHNSLDGRLSGAIFGLTLPGGFLLTYLLLSVLQWLAYGVLLLVIGLVVIVFMVLGLNVGRMLGTLFGITVTATRFLIIFAVGGVGTALLGSLWRSYYVEREYAADAYAARLGFADQLIAFFEHEVLSDVAIPWYSQPTHPPTTRRIEALRRASPGQPQAPSRPRAAPTAGTPWLLLLTVASGLIGLALLAAALLSASVLPWSG